MSGLTESAAARRIRELTGEEAAQHYAALAKVAELHQRMLSLLERSRPYVGRCSSIGAQQLATEIAEALKDHHLLAQERPLQPVPRIEPAVWPMFPGLLSALTPTICRGTGHRSDRCQCPYHAPNT